eukprot:7553474-Lingulodinium_polyedra.AAC.1
MDLDPACTWTPPGLSFKLSSFSQFHFCSPNGYDGADGHDCHDSNDVVMMTMMTMIMDDDVA